MYPIIFLDALRVKIRDAESRQVKNKAVYVAQASLQKASLRFRAFGSPTLKVPNSGSR
jgi:hypothetical protein